MQIFLVALWSWWIAGTLTLNTRFFAFMRPLVSGFVVGLILGDPVQGTIIGASINAVYIGWIAVGGALPGDLVLAGVLGPALGILANMTPEAALAFAIPIATLGASIATLRMAIFSAFVHFIDKFAAEGNMKAVALFNFVPNMLFCIIYPAIPVYVALTVGAEPLSRWLDAMPVEFLNAFNAVGLLLPALGFAMLLRYLAPSVKALGPFFVGFVLTVYLNVPVMGIVILAAAYVAITQFTAPAMEGK